MNSLFNVLSPEEVEVLSAHKSCATYKKGQILFSEGGFPFGVMCVNAGKIKLCTQGPDGKEQILRLAKDGEVLGYRASLLNERFNSTAIAIEDSNICIIDKSFFTEMVNNNPKLMMALMQKLSERLQEAEDHIVSLSQKRVRERMAEALLFLKATYGFKADGQTLDVVLSREELADYVGTSTESAIRLLSDFSKEMLINLDGKKIQLINIQKLANVALLND